MRGAGELKSPKAYGGAGVCRAKGGLGLVKGKTEDSSRGERQCGCMWPAVPCPGGYKNVPVQTVGTVD